jgi:two-component system, cell cycle response regulator
MFGSNCLFVLIIALLFATVILFLTFRLRLFIRLSRMDEMTSIDNYRGFRKTLKKVISKHKRNNSTFTIAIFDIDEFRNYNYESYAFGDSVLKEFVELLKQQLPEDAYLARFRFGDEFIIIMPSHIDIAKEKIDIIRDKCRVTAFLNHQNQQTYNISFSYGAAFFEMNTDTPESLLIKAEKALKKSKENVENLK